METAVLNFKRFICIFILYSALYLPQPSEANPMKQGDFLVLCYHSVPVRAAPDDRYSIARTRFTEHIEYLLTHGFSPVSLEDILDARAGRVKLPAKPVLLTFDDAYLSYYEFVVPFLEELDIPSVLAVVGRFIDSPPNDLPEPLMNWDQIREVSSHKLVEVVSHSYDLHKGIPYNPQGNVAPALNILAYNIESKTYESEDDYENRIESDFRTQRDLFLKKLGFAARAIVWPFGKYNTMSLDIARKNGYQAAFTLEEGYANLGRLGAVNRNLVENQPVGDFIRMIKNPRGEQRPIRAVQVDLDLIYDPSSYEQMDINLGKLIDRLVEMKVNTVFLQAFADPEGMGNIKSVYFYNRVLPVRADIFSHAVHQMIIRDITVYAWMPVLSLELPDEDLNERLKVHSSEGSEPVTTNSWYRRLTPFSNEVLELVQTIYEDLAAHSQIHGVLFQDDAYLTDMEDFHPLAVDKYKKVLGSDMLYVNRDENPDLFRKWTRYKTEVLIDFTRDLMEKIMKYRPNSLFARNLYSGVLDNPGAEMRFAQDFEIFLKNYDWVVVMAYPQMDEIRRSVQWIADLVNKAKGYPNAMEKTIFKIQTYDWRKEEWIVEKVLLGELRGILVSGGRHIAYYPDNLWMNRPLLSKVKLEMSTKTYPFLP